MLTHGPLSRTELARRLGLSRPSLTRLTKPLIDEGLFVESGSRYEPRTGRAVRPLDVAAEQRHFTGVNLTGHDLTAVLTTMRHDAREVGTALGRLIAAAANLTMARRIILTGEGMTIADVVRTDIERAVTHDREPLASPLDIDVQPSDFTVWARGAAVTAIQSCVLAME